MLPKESTRYARRPGPAQRGTHEEAGFADSYPLVSCSRRARTPLKHFFQHSGRAWTLPTPKNRDSIRRFTRVGSAAGRTGQIAEHRAHVCIETFKSPTAGHVFPYWLQSGATTSPVPIGYIRGSKRPTPANAVQREKAFASNGFGDFQR